MARWTYGAQCKPGRMAISKAWSRMPPISVAGSVCERKLSVPTRRSDRGGRTLRSRRFHPARATSARTGDLVLVDFVRPSSCTYLMPAPGRRRRGRWGVPPSKKVRELQRLRLAAESPPVPPSRQAPTRARGPHRAPPGCPVAADSDLCREARAGQCASFARRAAARRRSARHRRGRARRAAGHGPDVRNRCTVPSTLLACVTAIRRVFGVTARRIASGSMVPPASRPRVSKTMRPSSSIAVAAGYAVVAPGRVMTWSPVFSTPLNAMFRASVQLSVKTKRSGLDREQLFKRCRRYRGCVGLEGHLVPARPDGPRTAGEAVEGLIDGCGLGKTGCGVVEVDHWRPRPEKTHGISPCMLGQSLQCAPSCSSACSMLARARNCSLFPWLLSATQVILYRWRSMGSSCPAHHRLRVT